MTGNQNVYFYITPNFLNHFKYASITSVDDERTFSLHKHILSNKIIQFSTTQFRDVYDYKF
jgi:hypothetical protein